MRVLEHLRKPIPEARSQCARSELRQPDLCRAARVCQLFSSACETLLYTHVVTDRLPLFLGDDLTPRKRLFRHTRSLRIEYCEKGGSPEYKMLIGRGKALWKEIGLAGTDLALQILKECGDEVDATRHWLALLAEQGNLSETFPRLESIAIASIYGHQNDYWEQYEQVAQGVPHGDQLPAVEACTVGFYRLLRTSHIRHFCLRDARGPLTLPYMTAQSSLPSSPFTRTCHFPYHVDALHMPLGRPVQWVADFPASDGWRSVMQDLSDILSSSARYRRTASQTAPIEIKAKDKVELNIYCSTDDLNLSNIVPDDGALGKLHASRGRPSAAILRRDQTVLTKELGENIQKAFREHGGGAGTHDTIKWYPRFLAPTCQACGSSPPT